MLTRACAFAFVACVAFAPVAAAQTPAVRVPALGDLSKSLEDLAQKVSPCVVQLFVTGYAPADEQEPGGTGEPDIERSNGSGVILDPDGYIVTNAHVVENATRLDVELPFASTGGAPGRSIVKRRGRIVPARIIAADKETDLAVIKVEAHGLPALPFGDSDLLRPGQIVLAFGSPLGLDSSVTMGVVSAVARQLEPEDPMIYIQTDAPINPGNSGGALVDTDGRLVGVNTLIYTQSGGSEGIGFAAPANIVKNVFEQIRAHGRVRRGQIGVSPQTVTPLLAEALGLPADAGVILGDVDPDGPAAKAGLMPGDLVTALDGKPMENGRQFRVNLYTRPVGAIVRLDIIRGAQRLTVPVTVAAREDDRARLAEVTVVRQHAVRALGILVLDLTERLEALLPDLRTESGAVVAAVAPMSPYSQQGKFQAGDVIHAVNGHAVKTVADLEQVLAPLKGGAAVAIQIEREGDLMFLAFRIQR
ncbi:MAG TPA: trypsin-like peptidase domain-containing protein [Vicinamibacterales bacterium]|nr:trypsin-like peptidase domain-containing protein [Vicinamibacterales bacterium]